MRHSKKIIKLGRKVAHRKFMLANMASSLIEKKRINTTLTKANALKRFFEPLVTKSKNDTTHNRRIVFRSLRNKEAVSELFRNISKKIGDRPGGYTRVIKLGNRLGDNASMAMIELVDYNDTYKLEKSEKKKSTRRGRRSKIKLDHIEKIDNKEIIEDSIKKGKDKPESKEVEEKSKDENQDKSESKEVEEKSKDENQDKSESKAVEEKSKDENQDKPESKVVEEKSKDENKKGNL